VRSRPARQELAAFARTRPAGLERLSDIAAVNCDTDFSGAKTPTFCGNFPGGQLGVPSSPNMERIRAAFSAWLLMQDRTLRAMFVGTQCTMCSDPNRKVQQNNP
jgi:hypothetical protein